MFAFIGDAEWLEIRSSMVRNGHPSISQRSGSTAIHTPRSQFAKIGRSLLEQPPPHLARDHDYARFHAFKAINRARKSLPHPSVANLAVENPGCDEPQGIPPTS
jgi:hypothetical protein